MKGLILDRPDGSIVAHVMDADDYSLAWREFNGWDCNGHAHEWLEEQGCVGEPEREALDAMVYPCGS